MSRKRTSAARRLAALLGWRTRRKNLKSDAKRTSREKEAVRGRPGRAAAKKRKQKLYTRPSRVSKEFKRRSEAAKKGWRTRREKERKKKRKKRKIIPPPKPINREYFVVLLFKTRKNGKPVTRRLREAIVTLPEGATDEEIKKAYADWMFKNSDLTAQDIYKLVFAENRGRKIDMRIIPSAEPSAGPAGTVQDNDARSRVKRKAKKRKG